MRLSEQVVLNSRCECSQIPKIAQYTGYSSLCNVIEVCRISRWLYDGPFLLIGFNLIGLLLYPVTTVSSILREFVLFANPK